MVRYVRHVEGEEANFRPISMLDSLNTGNEVDVNMLLTSTKKSSELQEGRRDVGLSADIWVMRALMSRDERMMLWVLMSKISTYAKERYKQ